MMMYLMIAAVVMMSATAATHLGLPQAIAGVITKVCKCHKCLSFWMTWILLVGFGCHIVTAALLSLGAAYLSNWFGLVLVWLNKKYNDLWQRINQKRN